MPAVLFALPATAARAAVRLSVGNWSNPRIFPLSIATGDILRWFWTSQGSAE